MSADPSPTRKMSEMISEMAAPFFISVGLKRLKRNTIG